MNKIVEIARTYIGTPFHHQGRKKDVGVDCVGLLVCIGAELQYKSKNGTEFYDIKGYTRQPDGKMLLSALQEHLIEIPKEDMQPGDIVCVAFDKHPQHVGVLADYRHGGLSMIHADGKRGEVLETRLLFTQGMKFISAFRFKELKDTE